jgi:hypothetical protein
MANLGVASGAHASASDLMARDATEGSVSRKTLVVREEGKPPTHFVSVLYIFKGVDEWLIVIFILVYSNSAIASAADSSDLCIARST